MAEDDKRRQPGPVDGIAKARAALTEKDGVLEGNPGTVAENAKPAAGPVTPEGRAGKSAEGGTAGGGGSKDG